jgi:hypothetical protein
VSDRLSAAREYVAKKPTDRFGLYALAMELRKARIWPDCFAAFDVLNQHHPDYGAGYYHYGIARRKGDDFDGAKAVLRRGLEACDRSGDKHTRSEIQGVLEEMELLE